MAEPTKAAAKKTPKGGSKGGTRFPRLNIADALAYSKKLVSKTHNGPQPEQTILVGVFNNKGAEGVVRASALKQYGLMEGDAKGYSASPLARQIEAAIPEQRSALVQRAFLTPKLFKQVYDTLQSETASRARVRQVVVTGEVHPDSADVCVECFVEGATHAGLGTMNEDSIVLGTSAAASQLDTAQEEQGEAEKPDTPLDEATTNAASAAKNEPDSQRQNQSSGANKGAVTVNLAVDSSSDPDKLEKQLKLLKQYGLLR
ncbi:MAG: hypothetical protein ABSA54_08225 [Terriglobales bacterium]|jgi:hypothetical protein